MDLTSFFFLGGNGSSAVINEPNKLQFKLAGESNQFPVRPGEASLSGALTN